MNTYLEILNKKAKDAGKKLRLTSYEPELLELSAKEYAEQSCKALVSSRREQLIAYTLKMQCCTEEQAEFIVDGYLSAISN